MIEDMKVEDHLKFYGTKIKLETISFEQEIPNLVLYRDYYVNVPLITNAARYCTISNYF